MTHADPRYSAPAGSTTRGAKIADIDGLRHDHITIAARVSSETKVAIMTAYHYRIIPACATAWLIRMLRLQGA